MATTEAQKMQPEERERYHRAAEAGIAHGPFQAPEASERPKDVTILAQTDLLVVALQTVRDGGENNLHYHVNGDQYYFVLKGCVQFFGPDGGLYAELGPFEGITVPAGARYRFMKIGEETLEILQAMGRDPTLSKKGRFNIEQHKDWMSEDYLMQYEVSKDLPVQKNERDRQ